MNKKYNLHLILDTESAHKKIIDSIQENSVVLEVGTSHGHMTKYLKEELNCNVTGIEIDPEAARDASQYTSEFFVIDIDNIESLDEKIKDNHYDYIIMCDVIEHVRDTTNILKILGKKLKTSGLFLLSVPNVAHNIVLMQILKNEFNYQDVGMMDNTHIRWFTSNSFKKKIDETGLKLVKHDWTYMTPEYENIPHNNYDEFSLFEKEVLLKHLNGHFFQNIFHLSRDINSVEAPISNIDAYWFDKIKVTHPNNIEQNIDVFDRSVLVNIKFSAPEKGTNYSLIINPTMRMRGFKNISITAIGSDNIEVNKRFVVENAIFIDKSYYSFSNSRILINIDGGYDNINISFEYIDVTEDLLMSLLQRVR
ncbi:class I SAM-dependent methyltransferase [Kluyvera sichuanensis]|uniref:class I SAM-dependent methyltransferase n=1 Tax=Kluyvera sichuanensis TaxID=2725494 RepID=UPI0039F4FE0D